MASKKRMLGMYWMPVAVFILGMLSIVMLIWINSISQKQRMDFDICDALMDIQISTASFHLWIEETIGGNARVSLQKIRDEIDSSIGLAGAVLKGGMSEHGLPLQPLKDPPLRKELEEIHSLLTHFKVIALQRIENRITPDLEKDFHSVFKEVQDKAKGLEIVLEKNQIRAWAKARRLCWGILLTWSFIVAGATTGLWTRESRRRSAEKALQQANEELRKHEDHLAELVEERTAELTSANLKLQQEAVERKLAEKSLLASENKCRVLVDYLPQEIYLKDQNSVYFYCNDNFARSLNIRADAIIGKTDHDLFLREIAEKNTAEDQKILKSGKPIDVDERHTKNGQQVVIHKFKMPIRNETGGVNGILGILWDVTEHARLEAVAEAVTMMNNIGYIFAGIMHEIGNPISATKMTLSVLKKKLDTCSKETTEEYIERVLGEMSKVEYLLGTLKSFNMYETPNLQNVEMKSFMNKFLSLLEDDFGKKGITIERILSPEAQWGAADPRALQQVLLNVLSNASDAMEGRENAKIVINVLKADGLITIRVTDNGCGISEEQQKRLFMPFFTTKASGTGLGLIIAKKLLSRMNGSIEIKSRRDEGTVVEMSIQEGRDTLSNRNNGMME